MKIAIISQGDPEDRKGFFNNVHDRIVHLLKNENIIADVFLLRYVRNLPLDTPTQTVVDGITYHNLYIRLNIFRYIAAFKLKLIAYPGYFAVGKFVKLFKNYDILSVHSIGAMQIAEKTKKQYGIPYVITWHGSDVHTNPQRNRNLLKLTQKVMQNADQNFFVSKALMETSDQICKTNNKDVLYSGISDSFKEFDDYSKRQLKVKHSVSNKKVVAFIGNIIPIKNVLILPNIFRCVNAKLDEYEMEYWIIGDGKLTEKLKEKLDETGVSYRMFGKVLPVEIPGILNCVDVLVLPSINEGLPLVTEEALQCGTNVVGSNVGGISEVIGERNVFNLGDDFVDNISHRIAEIIRKSEKPEPLSKIFSWEGCTKQEIECYKRILQWK